jgi:glutaredoxin
MSPTNPPIKLYTLSTCSHCRRTKRFFQENGIDVNFLDIDRLTGEERESALAAVRKVNPDCTFPTICIGDQVIVGFHEDKLRKILGIE